MEQEEDLSVDELPVEDLVLEDESSDDSKSSSLRSSRFPSGNDSQSEEEPKELVLSKGKSAVVDSDSEEEILDKGKAPLVEFDDQSQVEEDESSVEELHLEEEQEEPLLEEEAPEESFEAPEDNVPLEEALSENPLSENPLSENPLSECPICAEDYDSKKHSETKCPLCNYVLCYNCAQTYLINDTADSYHCLNCKKAWNYDTLYNLFPRTYVDTSLKVHRRDVLFDKERAMLPAAQLVLEGNEEIRKMKERRKEILKELYAIDNQIYNHRRNPTSTPLSSAEERREFVMPCPAPDCRGFLSTAWKCGICEVHVCAKCREIKPDGIEHTCDEAILKSVQLMKQDSKPCPKCGSMIVRVSGCPQMWCTQCKTGFNWNTGKIDSGPVHNPHYFEWLQRNGGQLNVERTLDCDNWRYTDERRLISVAGGINLKPAPVAILGYLRHLDWMSGTYRSGRDNLDLRLKYLQHMIDDDKFKKLVQQREKMREKKEQIHQILTMYINTCGSMLIRVGAYSDQGEVREAKRRSTLRSKILAIYKEMDALESYAQECLERIRKTYRCVIPDLIDVREKRLGAPFVEKGKVPAKSRKKNGK